MVLLESSTDKLQIITASAGTINVYACFVDSDNSNPPVIQGSSDWTTNTATISTATTTDIVAVAGASKKRNVKYLEVFNNHASVANVCTVQHTDGTTVEPLWKGTLLPNECVVLDAIGGWTHYDSNMTPYSQVPVGAVTVALMTADVTTSSTTPAALTTLTKALSPGTYTFRYSLRYQAAATTTGIKISSNFTGTTTSLVANLTGIDTTAANSSGNNSQAMVTAGGGVVFGFSQRAASTAGGMTTAGVDTINVDCLVLVDGLIVVTVAGNLEIYYGSEVAAATTMKAGSALVITKVG